MAHLLPGILHNSVHQQPCLAFLKPLRSRKCNIDPHVHALTHPLVPHAVATKEGSGQTHHKPAAAHVHQPYPSQPALSAWHSHGTRICCLVDLMVFARQQGWWAALFSLIIIGDKEDSWGSLSLHRRANLAHPAAHAMASRESSSTARSMQPPQGACAAGRPLWQVCSVRCATQHPAPQPNHSGQTLQCCYMMHHHSANIPAHACMHTPTPHMPVHVAKWPEDELRAQVPCTVEQQSTSPMP